MSSHETDDRNTQAHTDALLETLLQHAGPRATPPEALEREVRTRFEAEWRRVVARRRRRRASIGLAVAASVALVAVLLPRLLAQAPSAPPAFIATIERVEGTPRVFSDEEQQAARANLPLAVGTTLATGNGRLAVRLGERLSLRLDQETRLTLAGPDRIELAAGQVYVDTGADQAGDDRLVLATALGEVAHVGTQYLVRVDPLALSTRVRSGRVTLRVDDQMLVADRGEALRVDRQGRSERTAAPVHGEAWSWAGTIAPPFEAEGRTLADFLAWVSRETGLAVQFDSARAQRVAIGSQLRGRIDLEPLRALEVILQTSDLSAEVQGGAIIVGLSLP